jgi:hypothetical protein
MTDILITLTILALIITFVIYINNFKAFDEGASEDDYERR